MQKWLCSDYFCSVAKSCPTLCDPKLPYPSPSPRVCSNSCALNQWCHPAVSSSVVPFSSCAQSPFPHFIFSSSKAWGRAPEPVCRGANLLMTGLCTGTREEQALLILAEIFLIIPPPRPPCSLFLKTKFYRAFLPHPPQFLLLRYLGNGKYLQG